MAVGTVDLNRLRSFRARDMHPLNIGDIVFSLPVMVSKTSLEE
jgi:hypothetical protein